MMSAWLWRWYHGYNRSGCLTGNAHTAQRSRTIRTEGTHTHDVWTHNTCTHVHQTKLIHNSCKCATYQPRSSWQLHGHPRGSWQHMCGRATGKLTADMCGPGTGQLTWVALWLVRYHAMSLSHCLIHGCQQVVTVQLSADATQHNLHRASRFITHQDIVRDNRHVHARGRCWHTALLEQALESRASQLTERKACGNIFLAGTLARGTTTGLPVVLYITNFIASVILSADLYN